MQYYDSGTVTGTSTTWGHWNYSYVTSDSTATTADYTWAAWNSTTTATSTGDAVWYYWNLDTGEARQYQPRQQTPEELAETARVAREYQAELQRQAAEQNRIAEEAELRAAALLKENLAPAQREEYDREKFFTVISKDGRRRYRVNKGWSHNVEEIDESGKKIATLCAHPVEAVPAHDNMLAQKLMLEHDEERFLRIANRKRLTA